MRVARTTPGPLDMRHHRFPLGSNRPLLVAIWPILIALASLPPSPALIALETRVSPADAGTTLDQLHQQLKELRHRVEGMEGKLKESALARKGADQARMEAERRLAEGAQAMEQLRRQSEALRQRQRQLTQTLADRDTLIERLTAELQAARESNATLSTQVDDLRHRLPESEGGTLTAEAVRKAAAEAFTVLREALRRDTNDEGAVMAQRIEQAEDTLNQLQLKLARVMEARGIYPVHANDTLASISYRFYGNSRQWQILFDANRHLLDDPDQLTPGMTLVIP